MLHTRLSSVSHCANHSPSDPPAAPSVLLRTYASTSNIAMQRQTNLMANNIQLPYAKNDGYPPGQTYQRPRRISEPSRDVGTRPLVPALPRATPATQKRPHPNYLDPRPASTSNVPRRPSPLASPIAPDPLPLSERPAPAPTAAVYPTAPLLVKDSTPENVFSHSRTIPDMNLDAISGSSDPRPRRRKLKKRMEADSEDRTCSRLSFSGLSSLFSSKKESVATPNMLLLKHRYTEQYIPPTFDNPRHHKSASSEHCTFKRNPNVRV
ncbi:hypothetical protein BDN70DRAFT_201420 [Pholiota conissans]|uniref:Uncharacterized protein n=1 Tax=Pholiota conissans TaxID=109636 RepID=A0A9P6CQL0_9AGAR|nr:hypothetical protein BDN70DRAFT_201420 [Pholiota conissans]